MFPPPGSYVKTQSVYAFDQLSILTVDFVDVCLVFELGLHTAPYHDMNANVKEVFQANGTLTSLVFTGVFVGYRG